VSTVGAGPLALAQARRVQVARLLIQQTRLPLAEAGLSAGFRSIRQFNEAVHLTFDKSPTQLRQDISDTLPADGWTTLRLFYQPPLASTELLTFLGHRALSGVEHASGNRYRRTIRFGRAIGIMELVVVPDAGHVLLRLRLDDLRPLGDIVRRSRDLLDLDVDPRTVSGVLAADPTRRALVERRPGLRVPGCFDTWEIAARAVLGQQVSTVAARTLGGRLVEAVGEELPAPEGGLTHLFPTAETVAEADLAGLGLTTKRAQVLRTLASRIATKQLVLEPAANHDRMGDMLLEIPGIGPWTIAYIMMRGLRDPDAFPATDLGIRRAFERLGLPAEAQSIRDRAEAWRPWRSYAATHLWTSLTNSDQSKEKA